MRVVRNGYGQAGVRGQEHGQHNGGRSGTESNSDQRCRAWVAASAGSTGKGLPGKRSRRADTDRSRCEAATEVAGGRGPGERTSGRGASVVDRPSQTARARRVGGSHFMRAVGRSDVKLQLKWLAEEGQASGPQEEAPASWTGHLKRRERVVWAVATLCALLADRM